MITLPIKAIFIFIVKVVLIELAIEFCRYVIKAICNNAFPNTFFISHRNRYLHIIINTLESACVITLLYLGYPYYFIILFTLGFTFFIQEVGTFFIKKS